MAGINNLLEQILSAIYGRDVRQNIHDAIEQCYEDAGNLAEVNTEAAGTAYRAAEKADESADRAAEATTGAERATIETNLAKDAMEAVREDVLQRLDNGEFIGSQGPQGEQGLQGLSGVTAPSAGMFTLKLNPATGDLYAIYSGEEETPAFRFDIESGNLYLVIREG